MYKVFNAYNRHNLVGLGLRFESHIPENVVDQMNHILVQNENLLRDKAFGRFVVFSYTRAVL